MRRRVLLAVADAWIWARAKYHMWTLFRTWPWRWLPAPVERKTS